MHWFPKNMNKDFVKRSLLAVLASLIVGAIFFAVERPRFNTAGAVTLAVCVVLAIILGLRIAYKRSPK